MFYPFKLQKQTPTSGLEPEHRYCGYSEISNLLPYH